MATAKKRSSKKAAKKSTKTSPAKSSSKKASSSATKSSPKKGSAGKSASKKTSAKKKESLVQQKRSTGTGPACWPGYKRVPGKQAGSKGSCEPKAKQSKGEKKADSRAAAGSKLSKAGGSKAKANRS